MFSNTYEFNFFSVSRVHQNIVRGIKTHKRFAFLQFTLQTTITLLLSTFDFETSFKRNSTIIDIYTLHSCYMNYRFGSNRSSLKVEPSLNIPNELGQKV